MLYTCDVPFCKEWAQLIRRNLARIGINVTTRKFVDPIARARRKGARADMLFTKMTASWPSSYPDAVTFLANVLETSGSADRLRRAVAGYCNCGTPSDWYDNAELEARLERIGRLGGVRREAAAGALDLELARDAPGAVLATETTSSFFSERVGCQTFQPLYFGVDIAALACARTADDQSAFVAPNHRSRAAVHPPTGAPVSIEPSVPKGPHGFEPARLGL